MSDRGVPLSDWRGFIASGIVPTTVGVDFATIESASGDPVLIRELIVKATTAVTPASRTIALHHAPSVGVAGQVLAGLDFGAQGTVMGVYEATPVLGSAVSARSQLSFKAIVYPGTLSLVASAALTTGAFEVSILLAPGQDARVVEP